MIIEENWPVLHKLQEEWISVLTYHLFDLIRLRVPCMKFLKEFLTKSLNIIRIDYFEADLKNVLKNDLTYQNLLIRQMFDLFSHYAG